MINCEQLKARTKQFALRVIRLTRALPQSAEARSVFWLKLLADAGSMKKQRLADLLQEAKELAAIFAASKSPRPRE